MHLDVKSDIPVLLSVRMLKKQFEHKVVLNDLNLDLYFKENLVVMGKSGIGKSVLIKCIVGLIKPDAGHIYFKGEDIVNLTPNELHDVRRNFGFLFQSGAIYDSMSVKENLEFTLRRVGQKLSASEIEIKIDEALDDVGLLYAKKLLPSELSGGMRKRVGLARTILMKPQVILYDEPTTGLDAVTSKEIVNLINQIRDKYATSSIIISHDIHCIKTNSDRIILLHDGVSYAEGSYKDFLASQDSFIQQFFT